ncbi:MAG: hypothetical protein RR654_07240, partial [Oscillospiraceae bacterium]
MSFLAQQLFLSRKGIYSVHTTHLLLTKKMSSRFRKGNQGFTGFSREILESPFTVDVQNSGAAF